MSGKHLTHRPGKGNAKSLPDVKLGWCVACGRYGLLSKFTSRCTGQRQVHNETRDRAAECRARTA